MGFWQTGYYEFHDDDDDERPEGWSIFAEPPQLPEFPCDICGQTFPSENDLSEHVAQHLGLRPRMAVNGQECSRGRMVISSHTGTAAWKFFNVQNVSINNGEPINSELAKERLSAFTEGVVLVTLTGEHITKRVDFEFAIAQEKDLTGVDEAIYRLVQTKSLTLNGIQGFNDATKAFKSAAKYQAGIAHYLYGVLQLESSSGSHVVNYRDKYNLAVAHLKGFNRPIAQVIHCLIAFHYNQLEDAARIPNSPRLATTTSKLLCLLNCQLPETQPLQDQKDSLDSVFSDTKTEQTIALCLAALSANPGDHTVSDIEQAIADAEEYDKLKLRIVLAEYLFRIGEFTHGLEHAKALTHNTVAGRWANWYSNRVEGQQ